MIPFELPRLTNPSWTVRNQLIAAMIQPNQSVLDMGCGAKDLLNYYTPTRYLGVDGVATADVVMDLDGELALPAGWDYVINSGILEYLSDMPAYIEKVAALGRTFIFTWHPTKAKWSPDKMVLSHEEFKQLLSKTYTIQQEQIWTKQIIIKCCAK